MVHTQLLLKNVSVDVRRFSTQRCNSKRTLWYIETVNKLQIPKLKIKRYSLGHSFHWILCYQFQSERKCYHKAHIFRKQNSSSTFACRRIKLRYHTSVIAIVREFFAQNVSSKQFIKICVSDHRVLTYALKWPSHDWNIKAHDSLTTLCLWFYEKTVFKWNIQVICKRSGVFFVSIEMTLLCVTNVPLNRASRFGKCGLKITEDLWSYWNELIMILKN